MDCRLLTRIRLTNYKSFASCDVSPAQLSFLVGPNGSGKSNFLDALRFVADSLRFSLDHALRDRGGIREVRRRSVKKPRNFSIHLDFALPRHDGHYSFGVAAKRHGGYVIRHEECRVTARDDLHSEFYRVEHGRLGKSTLPSPPAPAPDRLYLVAASGDDAFRPVYDALSNMGFYKLNPEAIRDLQPPDPGDLLARDGRNVGSVLFGLGSRAPKFKQRIEAYLGAIVPGITGVDRMLLGPKETIEFRQKVTGAPNPWRFLANNMSDGTLRALGVLVALFQNAGSGFSSRRLVGIEEPEGALHPAAAEVLTDSLMDASEHSQILVTSHSTDLLDNEELPADSILAVTAEAGESQVGPLDAVGRKTLKDRLFTAGELLRMNQVFPDTVRSLSS